jgi:hypothetical protein
VLGTGRPISQSSFERSRATWRRSSQGHLGRSRSPPVRSTPIGSSCPTRFVAGYSKILRNSLTNVRGRLDRLAARLDLGQGGGCPVCRPDEQQVRLAFERIPPEAPLSKTCAACGRSYQLEYVTFCWLPPQSSPGDAPGRGRGGE